MRGSPVTALQGTSSPAKQAWLRTVKLSGCRPRAAILPQSACASAHLPALPQALMSVLKVTSDGSTYPHVPDMKQINNLLINVRQKVHGAQQWHYPPNAQFRAAGRIGM